MAVDIRIDDLADPVLTAEQKAALAYGETLALDFSRESVLTEARERTGLSDFGSDDFHERLDLLLDEWGSDTGLTGIGRLTVRSKLVTFASSRLLIRDVLAKHPEIHDIELRRPIVVAGLPRSGTTHLLNLMAADTRLRSLPLWESYEPVALPGEEPEPPSARPIDTELPRYRRAADAWAAMQMTAPLLAAMHPMSPEHIHEELELMGPDFASYNFEWLSVSPRWRDHYYSQDQTPHYEYMRDVLKILQWLDGRDRRWVLKCPQHLEQLGVLRAVFPDATLAVTHRDPVAVIQSAVTMLAYGQRINRRRVETGALIEYWSDRIEHLLRACVRDRALWPETASIDVPFTEFMADDVAMVRRIYERADFEMTPTARGEIGAFMQAHPRGKEGRVIYDLAGDFGVEPTALRERFSFYFERFPVRSEVA